MPRATIIPGGVGNFGANVIPNDLTISAPFAATFTVSVGAGAAVPFALGLGGTATIAINNASVTVSNTTAGVLHPPAGNIILSY